MTRCGIAAGRAGPSTVHRSLLTTHAPAARPGPGPRRPAGRACRGARRSTRRSARLTISLWSRLQSPHEARRGSWRGLRRGNGSAEPVCGRRSSSAARQPTGRRSRRSRAGRGRTPPTPPRCRPSTSRFAVASVALPKADPRAGASRRPLPR